VHVADPNIYWDDSNLSSRKESKELADLRKEIQQLLVKLNRAKLARNKQEIRKLENKLSLTQSLFSQTQMFDTLSTPSNKINKRNFKYQFDLEYLAEFYPEGIK
jgi:hypothetical protein